MKKPFLFFVCFSFFLTAFLAISHSQIHAESEKIQNYEINIDIQEDSTLDIKEKIVYDFTQNASDRHGIFRNIPYYYTTTKMEYEVVSVTDESGSEYKYELYEENNNFVLKIGDPNKNVSGVKEYYIQYTMIPGIVFPEGENFAKFHWDVIGHSWNIPIEKADVMISFPAKVELVENMVCFTGRIGAASQDCEISQSPDGEKFLVQNTKTLLPNEGMTVELKFPRNLIAQPGLVVISNNIWFGQVEIAGKVYEDLPRNIYISPGSYEITFSRFGYEDQVKNIDVESGELTLVEFETNSEGWFSFLQILPYFFLPFAVFLIHSVWKKKGRDVEDRKTIVVEFDAPKDMTPMEMSLLKKINLQNKDVSATIIRFAVLGFMKIIYEEGRKFLFFKQPKYSLKKLKEPGKPLRDYEIAFFENIFQYADTNGVVKLEQLENKLSLPVTVLKQGVWDEVMAQKFFERDPRTSRIVTSVVTFVLLFVLGALGIIYFAIFLSPSMLALAVVVFISMSILVKKIPQRSKEGSNLYRHIEGLKIYLSVAEKERLKFHNAPEKKPETFEKLLPYAIVLGVEKQWAETFKDIYTTPPDWYEGGSMHTFNAVLFTGALTQATSSAASTMSTSSSSGGFGSGGGGGGGGGGSW